MQLLLTKDSPTETVLRVLDGAPLYHVYSPGFWTKKTTTIYKIPSSDVQRYLDEKKMHDVEPLEDSELARIHWHTFHDSRLIWDGKSFEMKELLRPKSIWTEDKIFTGPDGRDYRWSLGYSTAELKLEDGSKHPPVLAKLHQGNFLKRRKPMLEIDDSIIFMLDLVVITFVYAEARRRATVASRNASAASASSAASAAAAAAVS